MSSTIIQPIATAIGAQWSSDLTVHVWDPGPAGFNSLPCAVIGPPTVTRTPIDDADNEIGCKSWTLNFPFAIFVQAGKPIPTNARMVELVESCIDAIDDNPTLGLGSGSTFVVDDARVTNVDEPTLLENENSKAIAWTYPGTLSVLALVL